MPVSGIFLLKQRDLREYIVNWRALTLFFWGCLIASAAIAVEKHETRIKIVTDDSSGEVFTWQSSESGADISDLEVGDSRTLRGDDGREARVTRTADGFEFDVAGKTIELPDFVEGDEVTMDVDVLHEGDGQHVAHEIHQDGDMVIEKSKRIKIVRSDGAADVTIISSDQIDDETRARIEAALQDGGVDGEIVFIDGSELGGDAQAHGEHDIRIIRKKIETKD